jgi:predicted SprT family Zn-dependent metalloprotease
MLGVCLVLLLLNMFIRLQPLYLVALVILGLCYYRMFSKDYARRSAENQKYLSSVWKVKSRAALLKKRVVESRDYHIYRCPSCGQKIRIPRGKGHIRITCPKCRNEFEKKS